MDNSIKNEEEYYDDESYQKRKNELDLEAQKDLNEMRKNYAEKIFIFICCWSLFIGSIISFQGFKLFNYNLTDIAITTLIGTSFIQVLGLMFIVLKHIFPNDNKKDKE